VGFLFPGGIGWKKPLTNPSSFRDALRNRPGLFIGAVFFTGSSFHGFLTAKTYVVRERASTCAIVERTTSGQTRSVDLCGDRYNVKVGDTVKIDESRDRPPKVFAEFLVSGFVFTTGYLWWIARRFKFGPYRRHRPNGTALEKL
jgi:hypothetical protein